MRKGTGEGGIMGGKKRKRFVSASERAKFFMCFWGNKIEFAALTLDCKSRRLLGAAAGSALALQPGTSAGYGAGRAHPGAGCRRETGPRYGAQEETEAAECKPRGGCGGPQARTLPPPGGSPFVLSHTKFKPKFG